MRESHSTMSESTQWRLNKNNTSKVSPGWVAPALTKEKKRKRSSLWHDVMMPWWSALSTCLSVRSFRGSQPSHFIELPHPHLCFHLSSLELNPCLFQALCFRTNPFCGVQKFWLRWDSPTERYPRRCISQEDPTPWAHEWQIITWHCLDVLWRHLGPCYIFPEYNRRNCVQDLPKVWCKPFLGSLDQRTISSPLQKIIPIVSLASKTAWVSGGAVAAGCNNFPLQNFHRPFTRFKNRLRLDMLKMLYPQNGWVHCTKWPIHCTHFWAWPFQFSTASNPVWPQQCVAFFGWCHRVVNPPHGQQTGDRSLEHCLQCRKMILQSSSSKIGLL